MAVLAVLVISPDALLLQLIDANAIAVSFWRGTFLALGVTILISVRSHGRAAARIRAGGPSWIIAASCLGLATVFFVTAIDRTDTASVLATISAGPLFAAAIGRTVYGDTVTLRTWIASIAVLLGVASIVALSSSPRAAVGTFAALGASFAFASFLTVVSHSPGRSAMPVVAVGGAIAATIAAVCSFPTDQSLGASARDLAILLGLGGLIVPTAMILVTSAAAILPVPEVSLISLLEVLLGPLWVWLALGERPSGLVAAAGALIIATVAVHGLLGWRDSTTRASAVHAKLT